MLNALRKLLVPFSRVYGAIVAARNFFYDRGLFTITAVGTPVISVGNITAGGTGKTPLVEYIVRTILDSGARPAVLSRGYRRTTTGTLTVSDGVKVLADADRAGDEPAQIARKFPGCVVVVDEDRVRGARYLESAFHPDVIVLDDGFQHRTLRRDLDIVVVADGAGGSGLLPSGDGREPESSLRRADIVVKNMRAGSGLHGTGGTTGAGGTTGLGATTGVRMRYELKRFASVESGKDVGRDELLAGRFTAFCGIGNPASFTSTLERLGLKPESMLVYPDHHRYTENDMRAIDDAAGSTGAKYVVTTEKDAVRLEGETMPQVPFRSRLVSAVIGAVLTEGRETFDRAVLGAAGRKSP